MNRLFFLCITFALLHFGAQAQKAMKACDWSAPSSGESSSSSRRQTQQPIQPKIVLTVPRQQQQSYTPVRRGNYPCSQIWNEVRQLDALYTRMAGSGQEQDETQALQLNESIMKHISDADCSDEESDRMLQYMNNMTQRLSHTASAGMQPANDADMNRLNQMMTDLSSRINTLTDQIAGKGDAYLQSYGDQHYSVAEVSSAALVKQNLNAINGSASNRDLNFDNIPDPGVPLYNTEGNTPPAEQRQANGGINGGDLVQQNLAGLGNGYLNKVLYFDSLVLVTYSLILLQRIPFTVNRTAGSTLNTDANGDTHVQYKEDVLQLVAFQYRAVCTITNKKLLKLSISGSLNARPEPLSDFAHITPTGSVGAQLGFSGSNSASYWDIFNPVWNMRMEQKTLTYSGNFWTEMPDEIPRLDFHYLILNPAR